jgi:uncharacterized protein YjbI with pentapeptide repeats
MDVSNALISLEEGVTQWNQWRREGGAGKVSLTGIDLSETNLAGIDMSGVDAAGIDLYGSDLSGANLKMSDFEGADFSNAQLGSVGGYKVRFKGAFLVEANLQDADLSEADLRGADLRGSNLRNVNLQGALLSGARLDKADLTGASLVDADVSGVNFSFAKFDETNLTTMHYGGYKIMRGLYYGVRGLDSSFGNALFVRDAKDQDYLDTLEVMINRLPEGRLKRMEHKLFRLWSLIDYGRSLYKVTFYAFLIASIYSIVYSLDMYLGWGMMDYSNSASSWFTPFYYSIVTYTTLGFGDVTANNWLGEIIIISEVIVGYFTLGLLLAILANTIARRS